MTILSQYYSPKPELLSFCCGLSGQSFQYNITEAVNLQNDKKHHSIIIKVHMTNALQLKSKVYIHLAESEKCYYFPK